MDTLIPFLNLVACSAIVANVLSWIATAYWVRKNPWFSKHIRMNWLDAVSAVSVLWIVARLVWA